MNRMNQGKTNYIGKIILIGKNSKAIMPPAPPVCQVEGQQYTVKEDTIIKHEKGSIQFRLPAKSEINQRCKRRRQVERRRMKRTQQQRGDAETNRGTTSSGILDTGATLSCGQEDGPFIATGKQSNKVFQIAGHNHDNQGETPATPCQGISKTD